MINNEELLHTPHHFLHNDFILFSGPLRILTLLLHIPLNLEELLINLKEFLHILYDLPHNGFNIFSRPLSILTLLPHILSIL
jgi:hypothetical protein